VPELFVLLSCPSCGGKLDVYKDMERFACAYCGTEMLAQRRGGTVSLQAVTQAIRSLQNGTDRTAAELAIARYSGELRELQARQSKLSKGRPVDSCMGFCCGGLTLLLGLAFIHEAGSLAVVGAVLMIWLISQGRKRASELRAIRLRMRTLNHQIAGKKLIADS